MSASPGAEIPEPAIEPCVYCKSDQVHVVEDGNDACAACRVCGARGSFQCSDESAIEAWNRVARAVRKANLL